MASSLLLLTILSSAAAQEVSTPSSLLAPRNYNYHAHGQYLQEVKDAEPTKQGPVLFPNDAPPPPRPPLIVTSRPLTESIARSELNNTVAQSSDVTRVYRPGYLAKVTGYRPYPGFIPTPTYPSYNVQKSPGFGHEAEYDYVGPTSLPPIYQVIADHAKQKALKLQKFPKRYEIQVKKPVYPVHQPAQVHSSVRNNHLNEDHSADYNDQGSNYAFSYAVKDHNTGDDFSHSQQSSGSATNGEYRVRLPDGRMQIVSYTADENGYKADVRYDDEDKTTGNTIEENHDKNHYSDYNYKNHDNHYYNRYHDYGTSNNNLNNYAVNNENTDDTKHYNTHDYDTNHDNEFGGEENNVGRSQDGYIQSKDYGQVAGTQKPVNDDYFSDVSKEYGTDDDVSLEFGRDYNYEPHRSKFAVFANNNNNNVYSNNNNNKHHGVFFVPKLLKSKKFATASTVKPSYDELKPLLVNKNIYSTAQPTINYPIELRVPSTTPNPNSFDDTTEHVVVIGAPRQNLYTNIKSSLAPPTLSSITSLRPISVTPSPNLIQNPTPQSYLFSTIASLKNNVNLSGPKPVLSSSFIDRINKYLTFK